MARENLGQILIDAELVTDVSQLRELLAVGHVKQGGRILADRNEKIDTQDGPVVVSGSVKIFDWLDHSVS